MNFLLDNNLPPALARALNELCKQDGHTVVPLRDKFPPNSSDSFWITELSREGSWAVVSQDKFSKGEVERKAFRECGLPIFCLAKQWGGEDYWSKSHNLVRWWPAIIRQAEMLTGGAAMKVSWKYIPPGKFEQIKI